MDESWIMAGEIAISLAGAILVWLLADARFKSRMSFIEEHVSALKATYGTLIDETRENINEIEINTARAEQDRLEIRRMIDRIDNTKASKEVVDGFRSEISALKDDMDKRFDRLERILEKAYTGKTTRSLRE